MISSVKITLGHNWGKTLMRELNEVKRKLAEFEDKLINIEMKFEKAINLINANLVRVKNHETLSDDYIAYGRTYYDLSPEKAFEYYNCPDKDYILLDVSAKGYTPVMEFSESTKIPFNELVPRHPELKNKLIPYLVICENGVTSIKACELLFTLGFKNVNNISGGFKFWPGIRKKTMERMNPTSEAA